MSEHDDDVRVRALLRLAREVTARHDLDDVLAGTLRDLRSVVSFSGGSIQLIDDDGWITVAASEPPTASDAPEFRVPLGNSVAGRVVLTEQAIYVADTQSEGRSLVVAPSDGEANARCYLAVPLLADGRAIGLLRIDDPQPDAFSEGDRLTIAAAGVVVGAAIQNARAHARSTTARARVDGLEQRFEKLRAILDRAQSGPSMLSHEIEALLADIHQALGEPPTRLDAPAESPRITL